MTVWYTSDLHFGHRFVAELRGFNDVDDHDAALCDNWASRVAADDVVWVLGDLAMSRYVEALALIKALPGIKHLVAGNHDPVHPMHRRAPKYQPACLDTFASVQAAARRRINGVDVLLSHFPYTADRGETRYPQWRLPNLGAWLLHGHTHAGERITGPREIHVGVDAWGLAPASEHAITQLIKDTP